MYLKAYFEGCLVFIGPSELFGIHNVSMRTFDLHGLILYVSEDVFSELLCIHNVGMGSFDFHGLI